MSQAADEIGTPNSSRLFVTDTIHIHKYDISYWYRCRRINYSADKQRETTINQFKRTTMPSFRSEWHPYRNIRSKKHHTQFRSTTQICLAFHSRKRYSSNHRSWFSSKFRAFDEYTKLYTHAGITQASTEKISTVNYHSPFAALLREFIDITRPRSKTTSSHASYRNKRQTRLRTTTKTSTRQIDHRQIRNSTTHGARYLPSIR